MSADYIYLASPYTHKDPKVRLKRYEQACRAAAYLMLEGNNVFCPIAHSHPISEVIPDYAVNGLFWKKQDVPLLRHASRLMVLCLEGWDLSEGIKWEINLAKNLHMPVEYLKYVWEEDNATKDRRSVVRVVSGARNDIRV